MSDSRRVASLFEAHHEALVRFLTGRLRSAQEASEVAQDAYVRLLQLDAADGIGYLRAYLFKTAANLATDRLRSTARRERAGHLEFGEHVEAFEPSPETSVSAQQELATILTILDELPARCRYAFVMHRFYGHSVAEVAESMGLSVRMVQIYVERALTFCTERVPE
jgi:RNA polymerase sigma-70 factor (ECF subfamily)